MKKYPRIVASNEEDEELLKTGFKYLTERDRVEIYRKLR